MKDYKLTFLGLVIGASLFLITKIFDIELFESVIASLHAVEHYEADELIIPCLILLIFAYYDQIRRRKVKAIEIEKLKVYQAMLHSAHHVLNNFLNQVQIFKITANKTPGFDPKVLSLYSRTIDEASSQIRALGSITRVDESSIRDAVKPKSTPNS